MTLCSFIPVNLTISRLSAKPLSSCRPEARQVRYTPRNVWLRPFDVRSSGWTKYRYGLEMNTIRGSVGELVVPGWDKSRPMRGERYIGDFAEAGAVIGLRYNDTEEGLLP